MGLKGKLIAQIEMKCAGDLLHEHFKSNPHQTSTMSPNKITNFTLHEGQLGSTGSVVSWKFVLGKPLFPFEFQFALVQVTYFSAFSLLFIL